MPEQSPNQSVFRTVFSSRMLVMVLTGFVSGLPLLLTGSTLQVWLNEEGVSLKTIGLFALTGLPYTLKFLWAPLFDRFVPPFLGRRRGWMVIVQAVLAAAIFGLGMTDPSQSPHVVALLALAVTFSSASQDIVLDAYRRERLSERELGLGTSLFVNGYRGALLISGAFALFLADHIPWNMVYALMAGFIGIGAITAFFCREPQVDAPPPRTMRETVVEPFVEFFSRRGAFLILGFILFYKVGEQMASTMTAPFVTGSSITALAGSLPGLGFTKTEYAAIAKVFALISMLVGGTAGGVLMLRIGIHRALWIFGTLQAVAILPYALLAMAGKNYALLATAVSAEYFTSGMATSAYSAFMASQTNKRFTATQFALLSSLMGIPRVLFGAPTGWVALHVGWTGFFLFCFAMTIPGLVLLHWVAPWRGADPSRAGSTHPSPAES